MRGALGVFLGVAVLASAVRAEPQPAQSRVVSVGLFKNGLAVVTRTLTVPGPGTYITDDVPEPVHGTFWVESDAVVETRATTREVSLPVADAPPADLASAAAGKEVAIRFRDSSIPPLKGRVAKPEAAGARKAWRRDYSTGYRYYSPYSSAYYPGGDPYGRPTLPASSLIVETEGGLVYVDPSVVAYLEVRDAERTVTVRRPVLVFDVKETPTRPATVQVSYLAKGLAWAPSYRVDISDPKTLAIAQEAVIRNELEDVEDAEFYLISGFPSVEFANATSPLAPSSTWSSFFSQLAQRPRWEHATMSNVISQQAASYSTPASLTDLAMAALPSGEGPDLHYQPIGRRTLAEGDALALTVTARRADYDRVVEWLIPDLRNEFGTMPEDWQRQQDPDKYTDSVWDAVRFRNPLTFAMTTAPAMFVADGRFLGQQTSYWTNTGEQAVVHVTKALSIRTRSTELEKAGDRKQVSYVGWTWQQSTLQGQVAVANHRAEAVTVLIRRRFSGKLVSAEGEAKCTLLESGVFSANERNELVWTVRLAPGEEKTFAYEYTILVRM